MIQIEVVPNPNCESADFQVFQEMGAARPVRMMRLRVKDEEKLCQVTGLDEKGRAVPAYAQRVADSGGGVSFLIYGGAWGLRFKPDDFRDEPWDLENTRQWGEAFKFYGDEADIVYEDA